MTPEDLEAIEERADKAINLLNETEAISGGWNILHTMLRPAEDVITLLAHIRELEVYVMAGKLMERCSPWHSKLIDGEWYMEFDSETGVGPYDSFESAVRDAYKTLMDEGKE